MKEEDYKYFLDEIKKEEVTLKEISQKFYELTTETKRILDDLKDKSTKRKEEHGVADTDGHTRSNHHRTFPKPLLDKLTNAIKDVEDLHTVFNIFSNDT